jgi:hypothetical protein
LRKHRRGLFAAGAQVVDEPFCLFAIDPEPVDFSAQLLERPRGLIDFGLLLRDPRLRFEQLETRFAQAALCRRMLLADLRQLVSQRQTLALKTVVLRFRLGSRRSQLLAGLVELDFYRAVRMAIDKTVAFPAAHFFCGLAVAESPSVGPLRTGIIAVVQAPNFRNGNVRPARRAGRSHSSCVRVDKDPLPALGTLKLDLGHHGAIRG